MPSGGPFDLITGALGQTNPYDEARDYQARQNAANQAALPNPDGSTTPVPPQGGDPNAPGGGAPGPGGAKGPTPAQTNPASAQPNSTKTPEDLGSIMLDLQQYNQRTQGFNQAFGMGVAAFAQPRDRQMVSQMFNQQLGDPTKIGQFLMSANSQQQGQNRMNALGQLISGPQGDAIAKQLNMGSAAQLRAAFLADPQSVSSMIEHTQQPTPGVANIDQITRYMDGVQQRNPGQSNDVLTMIKNSMIAGMAGPDAEKAVNDAVAYKAKTGQDAPWVHNGVIDQSAYAQHVQNTQQLNDSVNKSKDLHANNIDKVTELQNRVATLGSGTTPASQGLKEIVNSSRPYKEMAQYLLDHPGETPAMAIKAFPKFTGMTLSDNAMAAISELQQIKGQQYSSALSSLHMNRPAATEVEGVNKGLSQLGTLDSLNPDTYVDQAINPMLEDLKTVRGNSYGAAQDFSNLPEDLKTYVNPEYLKGGSRNIEGSGSEGWADKIKPPQAEIDAAKDAISKGATRASVDAHMRSRGFRPTGY